MFTSFKIIVFILVLNTFTNSSYALKLKKVKVFTTDRIIPIVAINANKLEGLSGEFLMQSTKDVIEEFDLNILPWPRAQSEGQKEKNAIILPLARTTVREKQYNWLSKVFDDPVCFFTTTDHKSVENKKDIINLNKIGIIRGGAEESFLKELNVIEALDDSKDHQTLILKLYANRSDAILAGTLTTKHEWQKNNYPTDKLQCGKPYTYNAQSIATSLSSDSNFIQIISTAMEKFKKTPAYINLLKKYGIENIEKQRTIREEVITSK